MLPSALPTLSRWFPIDKKHTQFALSVGMMLGVRECVGGVNSLTYEDLEFDESQPRTLEEECTRVDRVKIPAGAYFISSHMATLPYRYKFKAYAPHIFSRIQTHAGEVSSLHLWE